MIKFYGSIFFIAFSFVSCHKKLEETRRPPDQYHLYKMVEVPAGSFLMGEKNEIAYLDKYYIDKTEVTIKEYKECTDSQVCSEPDRKTDFCGKQLIHFNNWGKQDFIDHPVSCISWNQAKEFCEWKGKKLPTEAEWEKAARGKDGRKYPWGDESPHCHFTIMMKEQVDGCGKDNTWPVASKPSGTSPYGAFDMIGNVWEWTADWYNPSSKSKRVLRGGSFSSVTRELSVTYRNGLSPKSVSDSVGFRCTSP